MANIPGVPRMKHRLATFFTGGTISMRFDPATGGAAPALSGEEIIAQVPGLDEIADIDVINFGKWPGPHVTPSRMMELARAAREKLADESVAGAVVTHGTDTLEETAYLLDLVLNDQLIAAAEATKTHTESTDTFQSRDFGPLGIVDKDRVIVTRRPVQSEGREHIVTDRIEERVDMIKMAAGADGRFINFAIDDGARGLVIEGLGRGNVTVAALPAIERAVEAGLPVVITSRCSRGRVLDTYAYEGAGRQLRKMGAILGGMLPSHKARIKLMLELGAGWSVERIRKSFEG